MDEASKPVDFSLEANADDIVNTNIIALIIELLTQKKYDNIERLNNRALSLSTINSTNLGQTQTEMYRLSNIIGTYDSIINQVEQLQQDAQTLFKTLNSKEDK